MIATLMVRRCCIFVLALALAGTATILNSFEQALAATAIFHGRIQLPARGPSGSASWQVPITVTFFQPGTTTAVLTATPTTDSTGAFTVSGPTPGNYDVRIKFAQALSVEDDNLALADGDNPLVDFGVLAPGDITNDDAVDLLDFSNLRVAFGTCQGQQGFNPAADLNADGCVDLVDFSLLRLTFGQSGPLTINNWPPTTCLGTLSGTITTNTTIGPGCYVVSGIVTVNQGVTLTIRPGTALKHVIGISGFTVNGALIAHATTQSPIVFTALRDDSIGGDTNHDGNITLPAAADWYAVTVTNTGIADFDNVTVLYSSFGVYLPSNGLFNATNSTFANNYHAGIYETSTASLSVSNSSFVSNGTSHCLDCGGIRYNGTAASGGTLNVSNCTFDGNYYGVYAYNLNHATLPSNSFSNQTLYPLVLQLTNASLSLSGVTAANNGNNAIQLSGSLSSDTTLAPLPGIPNYVLNGFLTVNPGATLTLAPAIIIKNVPVNSGLTVNGSLVAHGTTQSPITFTSLRDDAIGGDTNNDGNATVPAPANWFGLTVNAGGSANLDRAIVRYASYGANNIGAFSATNSTFSNNTYGVYQSGSAATSVHNSAIFGNTTLGAHGESLTGPVDATSNWWGDASGPNPVGSGSGVNFTTCFDNQGQPFTCYYVNFMPFLGSNPVPIASRLVSAVPRQ